MTKRYLIFTVAALMLLQGLNLSAQAQKRLKFIGELDFVTKFDNREYDSKYSSSKTFFSSKITPLVGLSIDQVHSFRVGTDLIVDFGDRPGNRNPDLIAYYTYKDEKFAAYVGIFPRRHMMGGYPAVIIRGSERFYDSNLEGTLLQHYGKRGFLELAVDWTSMLSGKQREKFVVYSAGQIYTKSHKFSLGYYASLFHYSVSEVQDGVVDNLVGYPYVAFNLKQITDAKKGKYQSLMVRAGWIQGAQRDRKNENKWRTPGGFQAELKLEKWGLGVHETFYVGDRQLTFYDRYGSGLYLGDPFYRTVGDYYNRFEIFWNAVSTKMVALKVSAINHYDGHTWSNWQQQVTFSLFLNANSLKVYKRR